MTAIHLNNCLLCGKQPTIKRDTMMDSRQSIIDRSGNLVPEKIVMVVVTCCNNQRVEDSVFGIGKRWNSTHFKPETE
jgi:hypothetical protein